MSNERKEIAMNRRSFLGLGVAGASIWALRSLGAEAPLPLVTRGPDGRILVVLQLSGGNDGLNTVVPFEDPLYRKNRPQLGLPEKDLHKIGKGLGLHPSLKGCAQLLRSKKLAIVQGIGYPHPNRSHFKSMDIWHAADLRGNRSGTGWLGRALDQKFQQVQEGGAELGINLSERIPLALVGRTYKPIAFQNPLGYQYMGTKEEKKVFDSLARKGAGAEGNPVLARLRQVAEEAVETSASVRKAAQIYKTPIRYPNTQIGRSLKNVAAMIAGKLPTLVYYTYHGGFDTHVNQAGRHANILKQLDDALVAFQADLKRNGSSDKVLLMVFSEFGRRVAQNRSGGTDHGTAGSLFLVGESLRGGIFGQTPSLSDLDKGDLKYNTDFRSVYGELLDGWMAVNSEKVLGGRFPKLGLL
ncbi:MAG TPA: DUF1501 domain-containing protein [Planctomycetes bacterium]|nr:DUF1501 domain-containing protein [Planctomycetota bacterium]